MALEYQRYGRNKETLVNKSYIDGGKYRRKFDTLTNNAEVNKALYDSAKTELKHRSGTLLEDMYWIDGNSGKLICSVTNSTEEQSIVYSEKIKSTIKTNQNIVTIHTHPHSFPPSVDDFNSCYNNGYQFGVVACHDGKVFQYFSSQEINPTLYQLYLSEFLDKGLTEYEAQIKTLKKLKESYAIDFQEVTNYKKSRGK